MHPPHERRVPSRVLPWAAAALALTFSFLPGIAGAQSVPSPAPSTAPAGTGGGNGNVNNPTGASTVAPPATTPVSHLPIIDLVPTQTYPLYYHNNEQLKGYDGTDVGGTVRVPVARWFNLQFDRQVGGTLDQPFIYAAGNGTTGVAGNTRDVVLLYHGTFTFKKYLSLDIGEGFRHRLWATGAGGTNASGVSSSAWPASYSSTEAHYGFAGLTYATHPIAGLHGTVFTATEQVSRQNVDHHVGVECTAAAIAVDENSCGGLLPGQSGVHDENPNQSEYYETTQTVAALIPLDRSRYGSSFSVTEVWGTLNWYENAAFPYRWSSAITYLLQKKFNNVFTLGLRVRDYHQALQGLPEDGAGGTGCNVSPNCAIHVGSIDILGTFHIDTNQLLH
jgi:hypothetical protein